MEEMVAPFLPFFDIYPYLCRQNRMSNPSKLIDNEKNDVTLRPLRHADSRNGRLDLWNSLFSGFSTLQLPESWHGNDLVQR